MSQHRATILIVDDEESIRDVLSRKLETEGYQCTTAYDGENALWKAFMQDFDLVISDIKMPGMSGLEVLSRIITDHPDISVIMITAVSDIQTAVQAMKTGAYDYVTKPFNLNDLLIRVERALERRRLIIENREYQFSLEQKVQRQIALAQEYYSEAIEALAREEMAMHQINALRSAGKITDTDSEKTVNGPELSNPIKEFARKICQLISSGFPDSLQDDNPVISEFTDTVNEAEQNPLPDTSAQNIPDLSDKTDHTATAQSTVILVEPVEQPQTVLQAKEDKASYNYSNIVELITMPSTGLSDTLQIYERLKTDPRIQIVDMSGSIEKGITVKLGLAQSTPILEILNDLPEVEKATTIVNPNTQDPTVRQIAVELLNKYPTNVASQKQDQGSPEESEIS